MKWVYGLIALFCVSLVSAGSIDNLDYKDKYLFWDSNRQIDDHNVIVDADTVAGQDVVGYISAMETTWAKDEVSFGGRSDESISKILWGRYTGFMVYDYFGQWVMEMINERAEKINERIDVIEARQLLIIAEKPLTEESIALQAALLKSARTGEHQSVGDWDCNGVCLKLGDI